MKKTTLPVLFALFLISACQSPNTTESRESASVLVTDSVKLRIDATLKEYVDDGNVVGASALIFEKGREVYYGAFGYSDREAGIPMDRSTIVRIYSMTKPVTGVALMTLYEKGEFQLDDPLSKYAPEFANMKVYRGVDASGDLILEPAKRPITIRDITRHTAGFPNGAGELPPVLAELIRKADVMNPENTLSEMARKMASLPLMFDPGEQWAYGHSVDVQAFLVERLSGQPFDRYVREHIFEPLGMNQTRYVVPQGDMERFAALYQRSEEGQLNRMPDERANSYHTREWPLKTGGSGLTSTLDDYMRFARMLVNGGTLDNINILKPETVKLMATNQLADSVTERMWLPSKGSVGFGIDFAVRLRPPVSGEENHGIVGEFFWDGAASTLFWVDPVNELTAVLFVQVMPFDRTLHKKFRDAVYGEYVAETKAGL